MRKVGAAKAYRWAYFGVTPCAHVRGGDTQRCWVRCLVSRHDTTLWAIVRVIPPVKSTIKLTRAEKNRRAILVPRILRSSKNVFRSCRGRHERVTSLNFRHIRRLAILAEESGWCLGLVKSPSEMRWKRQLPRAGPGVPVGLATFGGFPLLLVAIAGLGWRNGCCPRKGGRA